MRRWLLILYLLLIGTYSMAQKAVQEPVILTEGISAALPDFKKQYSIPIEGEVMDIEVPQKGDYYYAVTEDSSFFRLYRISLSGRVSWMRKWENYLSHRYIYGMKTSSGGEIVVVHTVDEWAEEGYTKVYNNSGNEVFNKTGFFYPSSNGQYLTYQDNNNFFPLEIYRINGEKLEIPDLSFLKGKRHMHRFLKDNYLLVYEEYHNKGYLYLLSLPEGKLQWTYELISTLWLIDFNERNCAYSDDYIALQGTSRPANVCLFDYNGNLIWGIDAPSSNHAISFIDNGKKLVTVDEGKYLIIIDVKSGEILNKILVKKGGLIGLPKFSSFNNRLFITHAFAFGKVKQELGTHRYYSHIIDTNPGKEETSHYIIRGVLGTKLDNSEDSPEVIFAIKGKKLISGGKYVEK